MFDSRSSVSNHINAVTGSIIKTYKESYFRRFSLKSNFADWIFREDARDLDNEKKQVVVIQIVVCGDMEVIAEIIDRKIYSKLFEKQ